MTGESRAMALMPTSIHEAVQLAEIMATANLVPDHLRGNTGDCLLIVMQAQRWGMDAVSVAQCTAVVRGKLCYEGKLIAAALYAMGAVEGRLKYEYSGSGNSRKVVVSGKPKGGTDVESVEGTVEGWATNNDNWKKSPDDMLAYRGTRQWARRHKPEAILGVYTPDEMSQTADVRVVATVHQDDSTPGGYSPEQFEANLPTWAAAIKAGKSTADRVIAKVESKAALTDEQKRRIRAVEIQTAEEVQ